MLGRIGECLKKKKKCNVSALMVNALYVALKETCTAIELHWRPILTGGLHHLGMIIYFQILSPTIIYSSLCCPLQVQTCQ